MAFQQTLQSSSYFFLYFKNLLAIPPLPCFLFFFLILNVLMHIFSLSRNNYRSMGDIWKTSHFTGFSNFSLKLQAFFFSKTFRKCIDSCYWIKESVCVCTYVHDYIVIYGNKTKIKFSTWIFQNIYLLNTSNTDFYFIIFFFPIYYNDLTKEQKLHIMMGLWTKAHSIWI